MGAFASGFGMGQRAYQQGIDNDRQKVLDGYKADEMARLKVTQGREDERFAAEDAAFANFSNVRSGISPEQQGQIQQTYGMTPQQTARSGTGLQAKLASYDAPDSYDMQDAPAPSPAGAAPAFNAQGLALKAPSKVERLGALEQLAVAKRDTGSLERLSAQRETAEGEAEDTLFATALHKNPKGPEAVEARTWINANSKKLSTRLDPKTGLTTFALVNGDGYDEHKVSPQDMAKVGIGMKRLLRGDLGGLDLISGVNKEIAASVAAEMNLDMGVGKANNSAVAQGSQMRNDDARTGIAAGQLGLAKQRLKADIAARQDKKPVVDPALIAESNRLYAAYQDADPAQRKVLERQYNMVQGQIATAMGKTMQLNGQGGGGKPEAAMTKVEEAGTPYRNNRTGGLQRLDGRGGYVAERGVVPLDRPKALQQFGIPDNLAPQVRWSDDGDSVEYRGQEYLLDSTDMSQLVKDFKRQTATGLKIEELNKNDNHLMNDRPTPTSRTPGLYDSPAQRAAHVRQYDAANPGLPIPNRRPNDIR